MTAQTQPEALRLADCFYLYATGDEYQRDAEAAVIELRRQHARIAELEAEKANLRDALSDIASGEILRSHCTGPHCTEELGVATADEMASRAAGALDWDDRIAQLPAALREKRQPLSDEQRRRILDKVGAHAEGLDGETWDQMVITAIEAAHNITGEPA